MAHVLVLGGYGLIGSDVVRRLEAADHDVRALGRDKRMAYRVLPNADWVFADLDRMQRAEDWQEFLTGTGFVVNCSGALQATSSDSLDAVHHKMVAALATACARNNVGLVQISAVGASLDASTEFLASKGRGDEAIRMARPSYWIIRPGMVLSPSAYGGSQMLRMAAAVPLVLPVALGGAQVQTVSVDDLTECVLNAVEGQLPSGITANLVEANAHSLEHVIREYRKWLGFEPARFVLRMPRMVVVALSKVADLLGILGWRSPLRGTALAVLQQGVEGTPDTHLTGKVKSLNETLASMPARFEDRLAARAALCLPFAIAVLSLFWLSSGLIGLMSIADAANILRAEGWPAGVAYSTVALWSMVDIALAGLVLIRRCAGLALLMMIAVSVFYLLSASILTPNLWLDPLGPLVKVLPAIGLAVVAQAILEAR